jgi:hypothetical protein
LRISDFGLMQIQNPQSKIRNQLMPQ